MTAHLRPNISLISASLLLLATGCGQPSFYQCEGVVTHEGKPVGPLQIVFSPENPDSGRPPMIISGADGKFKMETGRDSGVKPGKYTVQVADPVAADGRKMSSEPDYLYVIDRYSPEKSDYVYEADSHQGSLEIKLDKKDYTGPAIRKAAPIKNTTGGE